jgi:hypothetical protein
MLQAAASTLQVSSRPWPWREASDSSVHPHHTNSTTSHRGVLSSARTRARGCPPPRRSHSRMLSSSRYQIRLQVMCCALKIAYAFWRLWTVQDDLVEAKNESEMWSCGASAKDQARVVSSSRRRESLFWFVPRGSSAGWMKEMEMEMKMVLRCQAGRPVTRRAATPRRDDHPYFFSRFIIANISDNDEPTLTLHTCSTSRHGKRIRPYWTSRTAARAAFHPRWTAFQTPHRREGGH